MDPKIQQWDIWPDPFFYGRMAPRQFEADVNLLVNRVVIEYRVNRAQVKPVAFEQAALPGERRFHCLIAVGLAKFQAAALRGIDTLFLSFHPFGNATSVNDPNLRSNFAYFRQGAASLARHARVPCWG